jgi:HSP20 family protein
MANITVRRSHTPQQMEPSGWDPFRNMRDLFRWDPFREMAPLAPSPGGMTFAPDFEVKETKEGYQFKADVPGMTEKDIEISATGNVLTMSGKREAEKEDKDDTFYVYERTYGTFARSFTLPGSVDIEHIRAELKSGVLTVLVPKKAEAQPKKITITSSGTPS